MHIQATDWTIALVLEPAEARALLNALPVVLDNPPLAKLERALDAFLNEESEVAATAEP